NFERPTSVAVDRNGNVYVVQLDHPKVQKFNSNGELQASWDGSLGAGGKFNFPTGIAVDGNDYVYVVDNGNSRIQKFNTNGDYVTHWGTVGSGDGQFVYPYGVGVDGNHNVYVADTGLQQSDAGNNRIQVFDGLGNLIRIIGTGVGAGV